MQKQQTLKENIFNKVWAACDTFRGVIDPNQYKDYILSTLFVKYLSDVRRDKIELFKEKYGIDKSRKGSRF